MNINHTESFLIQNSILATLAYYDVLSLPATLSELCRFLLVHPEALNNINIAQNQFGFYISPIKIMANLEMLIAGDKIQEKRGFYFLKNRQKLIPERIWKDKISQEKLWRSRKLLKLITWIPFIKLLMISGSLVTRNARLESDYDLLVVTQKGRVWITRAVLASFLKIIGLKRDKNNIRDRFCLNHFITDESLNIPFESVYNANNYCRLIPIIEDGIKFKDFLQANQWIKNYILSFNDNGQNPLLIKKNRPLIKAILERLLAKSFGDRIEIIARKYQQRRIQQKQKPNMNKGRITLCDQMLEFHPSSPETKILEKFNKLLKDLAIEFPEAKDSGLN